MLECAGEAGLSHLVASSLEQPSFLCCLLAITIWQLFFSDYYKGFSVHKSCFVSGAGQGCAGLRGIRFSNPESVELISRRSNKTSFSFITVTKCCCKSIKMYSSNSIFPWRLCLKKYRAINILCMFVCVSMGEYQGVAVKFSAWRWARERALPHFLPAKCASLCPFIWRRCMFLKVVGREFSSPWNMDIHADGCPDY